MSGVTIEVSLPKDRSQMGTLKVKRKDGTVILADIKVLGRADTKAAENHRNPNKDPLKKYGHTPLGGYDVVQIRSTGDGTRYAKEMYGGNGAIVLKPVSGDAAIAALNGRTGLLIHGGRDRGPNAGLVATNGCLRVKDGDMKRIIDAIVRESHNAAENRCEAISIQLGVGAAAPDEGVDEGDPPPMFPDTPIILP